MFLWDVQQDGFVPFPSLTVSCFGVCAGKRKNVKWGGLVGTLVIASLFDAAVCFIPEFISISWVCWIKQYRRATGPTSLSYGGNQAVKIHSMNLMWCHAQAWLAGWSSFLWENIQRVYSLHCCAEEGLKSNLLMVRQERKRYLDHDHLTYVSQQTCAGSQGMSISWSFWTWNLTILSLHSDP